MNESGILKNRQHEFEQIFHPVINSWENLDNKEIKDKFFATSPINTSIHNILMQLSGNSFRGYNSLISSKDVPVFPTGTCFPFDRKLFLTTNGEVLPCERINQKFSLGKVTKEKVDIDFKEIAQKYSNYYRNIWKLCETCYTKPICSQCIFYVDNIEAVDSKPICRNYKTKKKYDEYIYSRLSYLGKDPELYTKIMTELF